MIENRATSISLQSAKLFTVIAATKAEMKMQKSPGNLSL